MFQRSNLFSQIQNGQYTNKPYTEVPFTKFSIKFLQILQEDGFISHWTLEPTSKNKHKKIRVYYQKNPITRKQIHFSLKMISTPTRPATVSLQNLHIRPNIQTYIISTSRGLMNDRNARQFRLGGELVCIISIALFYYFT